MSSFPHPQSQRLPLSCGSFLVVAIGWLMLSVPCSARAENEPAEMIFLGDHDYGTERLFSPVTVLLNSGFDIFRSGAYDKSLLNVQFGVGAANVVRNLASPIQAIQDSGGAGDFVSHEIFPYRAFNTDHGHFVPNYFLHVLGEGMVYRKLEEYYLRDGFPYPRTAALLTIGAAQFLNETVENGAYRGANVDPVADILIFNPLGWLLFSSDAVARFFSSDDFISINFWPGQPALDLQDLSLYNSGESYVFRVRFGAEAPISSFNYMGSEGLTGLSYRMSSGDQLSVAGGYRVVWLEADESENARVMAPTKPGNWVASLFWDRHESLLMSLQVGVGADPTLRMNMYPGVFGGSFNTLGAFVWASPHEGFIGGLTLSVSPVGLAFQGGGTQSRQRF